MDLTQGSEQMKQRRAKKMMLWFGMISIAMTFAGLTSAYVVSKSRPDWIEDLEMPSAFIYSTIAILLSSITFHLAKIALQKDRRSNATMLLVVTLVLGLGFVGLQFLGYQQIIEAGYNFTGPTSNIAMSFIYIISFAHVLHMAAGILVLLVVFANHLRAKYTATEMLGLELGLQFWHFLDFMWLYLFAFFYFLR